jgi:alkyl hydroperoxide reductase subunit AhpC
MSIQLGATAPDFQAQTTEGPIRFHDWIGDSWAVLFSHPKDFTPVCTTELGYMAQIKPEFDRRRAKIIGLSVDPIDRHAEWAKDIEETQGAAPNYPIICDADFNVSKAYGMLPANTDGDPLQRTPADNQTVRNVFVIGPDKKVKLILVYPMTTGRNFDEVLRVIDSLQLTANHKVATPVNWRQGEDVIIAGSVSDEQARELFGEWRSPKPYMRIVPQPSEFGTPTDLKHNRGLVEDPAAFAHEAGAASWLYMCGEEFASMEGGMSYADVQAAVPESVNLIADPPMDFDMDVARRGVAALDKLPRPTLVTCRTGPRSSALVYLYSGLRSGASADWVLARAEADGAPFAQAEPLKAWVTQGMAELS